MRQIALRREGEWLILAITGTRNGREYVKHVYLRRDEAAMVVQLLTRELGEVVLAKIEGHAG